MTLLLRLRGMFRRRQRQTRYGFTNVRIAPLGFIVDVTRDGTVVNTVYFRASSTDTAYFNDKTR